MTGRVVCRRMLWPMIMLLLACQGPRAADQSRSPETSRAPGAEPPKVLVLGIAQEPPGFVSQLVQGTSGVGGNSQVPQLAHNFLMVQDPVTFAYGPQLAAEPLSVENGTWRVNPDGTMDTTWKLKPNIKWHDGTPFTSEDVLFSLTVFKDPEIPNSQASVAARMLSATAPDLQTFVIHWGSVFVQADRATGLTPLPRHLLQGSYESQRNNLVNSPRLGAEFVGLGPYQLTRWESGVSIELRRFDDYYLGRPGLDGITVRFLSDPDTLVATIDPTQRVALHRELLQEQMGDVALMPMYWRVASGLAREGVRGFTSGDTWNSSQWRLER